MPSADPPVAIVTGGGTGIGAATVRRLTRLGYRVVITGRRPGPLEQMATETGAVAIPGDLTDPEHPSQVVAATIERFGRLDGVVLNAGVFVSGTARTLAVEDWHRTIDTNLTAPFTFIRAAISELLRTRGSIVSVASTLGMHANLDSVAYCASKAGLIRLIQCVAADHAHAGLRANIVCPGVVRTDMAGLPAVDTDRTELGAELIPQKRFAEPDEIAAVITWLLSPDCAYINGTAIPVDGAGHAVDAGILGSTLPHLGWRVEEPDAS